MPTGLGHGPPPTSGTIVGAPADPDVLSGEARAGRAFCLLARGNPGQGGTETRSSLPVTLLIPVWIGEVERWR